MIRLLEYFLVAGAMRWCIKIGWVAIPPESQISFDTNGDPHAISGATLPSDAVTDRDRTEIAIALRCAGFAQNGRHARRGNHPCHGMSLQYLIVDRFAVVGTVGAHRANWVLDLIQQILQGQDIADIICREVHRDDFLRLGVKRQMQRATSARPDPVFLIEPLTPAVDLHPGAVDQHMQRLVALNGLRQNLQCATAPAERRVIWDSEVDAKQVEDRSHRARGFAKRLMKNQAQRQPGLYRHVGIDGPTATLTAPRRMPAASASSVTHNVRLPHRIRAAS
jgi:hypothetical protein